MPSPAEQACQSKSGGNTVGNDVISDSELALRLPLELLHVLLETVVKDAVKNSRGEGRVVRSVRRGLPANSELGNFASRVPLGALGHLLKLGFIDAFNRDRVGAGEPRLIGDVGIGNVLVKVHLDHAGTLGGAGQVKLDHFVSAVVDGPVKLLRLVGGVAHHELFVFSTSTVEEGVEGVAEVFAHVAIGTLAEEGIGLVHEYKEALAAGVGPVEELVDLGHAIAAKRGDVTTSENGKVHARAGSKLLGKESLTSPGRAVEHGVAVGGAVLSRVGGGDRKGGEAVAELVRDNDAVQSVPTGGDRGAQGLGRAGKGGDTGGLTNERRLAKPGLDEAAGHAGANAGAVNADGKEGEETHGRAKLLAVLKVAVQALADHGAGLLDTLQDGGAHLLLLHLGTLHVEIPVLAFLVGLALHLGLDARALGVLAELCLVLGSLALHGLDAELELLLALDLLVAHLLLRRELVLVALARELVLVVGLLLLELVVLLEGLAPLALLGAGALDLHSGLPRLVLLDLSECLRLAAVLLELGDLDGLYRELEALELLSGLGRALEGPGIEAGQGAGLAAR
mmetsp:Transcript_4280/g.13568  ORF Transcript_4280/g.13568 Transcript_4280/m.13568 type:complete len:567 (-) Transcript_4280:2783-4483(-)